MSGTDKAFVGSIPEFYETYLVPLIFDVYAVDLARRVAARRPRDVLELAAGTGVVTRALANEMDDGACIVATDLNQDMLDYAKAKGASRGVEWRQADALALPFGDESFDVVVCQFGVMFFPDKMKAYSEAHRVLRPGGTFIFNVWDALADNEFADVITTALEPVFPHDPPRFLARTPYGYHSKSSIGSDLAAGGFAMRASFETVAERSHAQSADIPVIAFCRGTPLFNEIEAARLDEAIEAATHAIAQQFGPGPVDAKIQALIVTVER